MNSCICIHEFTKPDAHKEYYRVDRLIQHLPLKDGSLVAIELYPTILNCALISESPDGAARTFFPNSYAGAGVRTLISRVSP